MKSLNVQKRLASQILKCSKYRIRFDKDRLDDIREAITKYDLRKLISEGAITRMPKRGTSSSRSKKIKEQKRKGRQKGQGSRKGKSTARLPDKQKWINRIRLQRKFLRTLKDKKLVSPKTYRMLYTKSKGGFFRSKRHVKIYLEDKALVNK